jgi:DNA polymerase-3 subunit delta'
MKYIWPEIGNQKAIDLLEKNIENAYLANSYIFSGIRDLGKFSLAKHFARNIFVKEKPEFKDRENLLEINKDFLVIEKQEDKKNISIEQIRSLISFLSSGSFLNSYRIVVIKDAENLNQNSANALLKILEDFKEKLVVILTVNNIDSLPKTIVSRSQIINLSPLNFEDLYSLLKDGHGLKPSEAKNIAKLSLGRPMLAKKFIKDSEFYDNYRQTAEYLVDFLNYDLVERGVIINDLCRLDSVLSENLSIIDIWQSLFRDLNFLNSGRPDLIQNDFLIEKMKKSSYRDNKSILIAENIFKKANNYLASNMSLKSVLDYIAINI